MLEHISNHWEAYEASVAFCSSVLDIQKSTRNRSQTPAKSLEILAFLTEISITAWICCLLWILWTISKKIVFYQTNNLTIRHKLYLQNVRIFYIKRDCFALLNFLMEQNQMKWSKWIRNKMKNCFDFALNDSFCICSISYFQIINRINPIAFQDRKVVWDGQT